MLEELKVRQSEVWSSAPWEHVAPQLAPVHEHLMRALQPAPGVRWVDVATGTFELEFEPGDSPFTGESGEAIWQLVSTSAGPMKARTLTLEAHRTGGGIHLPAPYVLVLGTRR